MHVSRRLVILTIIGVACGATWIHADRCEPFTVSLHLEVDRSITSRIIPAGLKKETERLWRPYDVRLDWADQGAREASPHVLSIQVILERTEAPRSANESIVLGRAPLPLDPPLVRPIRLSFDATKRALALSPRGHTSSVGIVREHELARALGRVLAHEIGHVLLSAPFHEEKGLMRAAFPTNQLADDDARPFRLTTIGVERLRGRVRVLTDVEHRDQDRAPCDAGQAVTDAREQRSNK